MDEDDGDDDSKSQDRDKYQCCRLRNNQKETRQLDGGDASSSSSCCDCERVSTRYGGVAERAKPAMTMKNEKCEDEFDTDFNGLPVRRCFDSDFNALLKWREKQRNGGKCNRRSVRRQLTPFHA